MNTKSQLFPSFLSHLRATMIWLCVLLFSSSLITAQEAYLLGDDNTNQFTEVKSIQNSLFATGSITDNVGNTYGTFSEVDPITGTVLWTAQLDIPSRLNDFVWAGNEFIAVGRTEPIQDPTTGAWQDNRSLVCKISMSGAVTQTRVYQVDADGGREGFTKIVRNTSPIDAAYPFYISGHADLDGTASGNANSIDDLIVTNIDFNLNVLFTRRYFNSAGNVADEELSRVLISLNDGSGQMVLMGNEGASGTGTVRAVAFYINNDGSVVPASERHFHPTLEVIQDAILLPNRQFVIVGRNAQNTNFIMKTDGAFNPFWAAQIPEHQEFVKIIQHQEDYYTVMLERNSTNQNRYIVNRIKESGTPASPFLDWSKTLHDNDNTFSHPFIHSTGNQIVYGNSRIPDVTGQITSGYGAQDIMLAVTDGTLETCITQPVETELISISVDPQEHFISSTSIDMPSFDAEEWHFIEYASTDVCESSCPSDCVTNSIILNTGYDHVNGTTYAPGTYDAFWTLVQSPDAGITLPRPAYAVTPSTAWSNQTNTSWISAYPFANFNQNNTPPATPYSFQFCFCVCEDDTEVTFDLSAYADNNVFIDLYDDTGGFITDLVDVTSPTTSAFQAPPEMATVTTTLNEGTYCIRADLHNLSAIAMGFNMMGTISGGSLIEPLCCSDANYITGFKFNDKNCDGQFSGNTSNEPLLSGWDIQVCDALNNVVATATTDALGFYVIPNLPPGTYTVKEVNQPGWVQTYPGGSGIHTVTIGAGEVVADIDFGNINPEECNCTDFFFSENPNPDYPDNCCYDIILDTSVPDYYTSVKITPVGGSFTGWNNAANWNYVGIPTATSIELEYISGPIPAGSHNAINVCISTTTTVLIEWLVGDEVICEDERILECDDIDPCDNLMAMFDHIPNSNPDVDECCYEVDLKNYYGNNVTRFEMTIMTPGVIFDNGTVSGGYTWDIVNTTSTNLSVNFGGGNLPMGDFADVIEFCLGNTTSSPIFATTIVYRWYEQIPGTDEFAICEQSVTLQCEMLPPTNCVELIDIRVDCDENGNYVFKFKVENNTNLVADHVLFYNIAPAGFVFDDIYPSFPPLAPGNTSGDICLLITPNSPVLSPTNLCFDIALFGTSPDGSAYPCCFADDEVCITLDPCCDPCEGTSVDAKSIQVDPNEETCCWALDLVNECEPSVFNKVEIEVTTPGVIFGSHFTGGTNPADWNNPLSTATRIQWAHNSGTIPNGLISDVINFCLDDIDDASEVPQTVVVKWITVDAAGNEIVACEDVITLDCPFEDYHCAEITEDVITCNEDGTYNYCFTVTNTSTDMHDATHILLNPTSPSGITFTPDAFPVTLPYGASVTICTTISSTSPLSPGDKITFDVRLANLIAADHWCCFESEEHCVFIPECPDDCCDVSPNEFHDWVNQGFSWNFTSSTSCDMITAMPNYDFDEDCDVVTWIWGDGSPNDYTAGNNSVMHTYPGNGAYTICMIVTRYAPDGSICQVAEWCETIQIDCPSDCCDVSPNEFHDWVNQGFTWGLTTTTDCKTITATPNYDFDESCDRVTWIWGDGSSNSNSGGNSSVTHTFPGTGTYNVCMIVTRYAPDGSICMQAEWCTTITIDCPTTGDCCDVSQDEFFHWVNQNFYVTLSASDCKTIFVDPAYNFDEDCDEITWIWGDGSPNTVVMGNGTVSHTYPGNGVYQVCMVVTRYNANGDICMIAEVCQDVFIENCECLCDEYFYDDVNAGYTVTTGFCRNRTFTANEVGLNDCDKVVWSVQGPGVPGLGFMGTSFSYNFPSNGYYEVCMYVTRTNPITGEECEAVYCKVIKVTCSPWVVVNTVNVVTNYGFAASFNPFTENNTTRSQMVDWQTAMGTPEVIEDSENGCEDENFAELAGNKTSVDGLQQLVSLEADTYYDLSYCYQFLTALHGQPKVGTELVFRASKTAQTTPDCVGDCDEIGRFTLSANPSDTWSSVQQAPYYSGDMSGNVYITIHIENEVMDDGTDASKSIINIDNIVLEAVADNCDDDNVDIIDEGFVVTGYPNVKAKIDLSSNVVIGGNAIATYKAGNSITLNSGFEVMLGTDMTIDIEDCTLTTLAEENIEYRDDNDTDVTVEKVASLYCYPNPFRHNATIEYELPSAGTVQISVFNMTGKQVTNLLPNQTKDAGLYQVTFDANNLSDGVYYVRMAANGQVTTQKIVLLK